MKRIAIHTFCGHMTSDLFCSTSVSWSETKDFLFLLFLFFFVLPSLLQRWRRMEAVVMAEIEMRLTVGVTSTWSTLRPCGSVGALSGSEFLMALPNWTWHTTHMKADQCREGNIRGKVLIWKWLKTLKMTLVYTLSQEKVKCKSSMSNTVASR